MKWRQHVERTTVTSGPALLPSIAGPARRAARGNGRDRRSGTAAVLGLLGLCAAAAPADTTGPPEPATFLSLGPAVEVTPIYPGAKSSRTFALPDVEAQYDHCST
jgi:hypothetical protein